MRKRWEVRCGDESVTFMQWKLQTFYPREALASVAGHQVFKSQDEASMQLSQLEKQLQSLALSMSCKKGRVPYCMDWSTVFFFFF